MWGPPYLGASKTMTKDDAMTQVYTCSWTKAGHSLKYSSFVMLLEAPRYGGRSDIMFLKPNWSPFRGLIYAHLTSTLRCHWDCGAHDHVQGVVPMLSTASQCIHVTIPLPLNLFHPVTLFSSERRLAALVLSLLKEARGSALKVAYGDPLPPLTRY